MVRTASICACALVAVLWAPGAYSQSQAYPDADNLDQALGMLHADVVMARKTLSECSRRFPADKTEMEKNFREWQSAESTDIQKALDDWDRHLKIAKGEERQQMVEFTAYLESTAVQNLDMLASAPVPKGSTQAAAPSVQEQQCRRVFADFASGVWRKRTPHEYKFLDEAPATPASAATPPAPAERPR